MANRQRSGNNPATSWCSPSEVGATSAGGGAGLCGPCGGGATSRRRARVTPAGGGAGLSGRVEMLLLGIAAPATPAGGGAALTLNVRVRVAESQLGGTPN